MISTLSRQVLKNVAMKESMKLNVMTRLKASSTALLIHHSDRGLQYCSELYQAELAQHEIQASMTDGYDCYQNALAERVNGILQQEFLIYQCPTFNDLKRLVDESIEACNRLRPHLSLGMKTPEEVIE